MPRCDECCELREGDEKMNKLRAWGDVMMDEDGVEFDVLPLLEDKGALASAAICSVILVALLVSQLL